MNSWWLLVFKLNAEEIKKYFTMISVIKVLLNVLDGNITDYNYSSTCRERIDRSLKVFIVTVYINLVWVASEE